MGFFFEDAVIGLEMMYVAERVGLSLSIMLWDLRIFLSVLLKHSSGKQTPEVLVMVQTS